jgi:hypothetical protein
MAIIQTIDTASQFRDQFHRCGRADQFSYEALGLLFDYLNDCGSDVELDVVGICCEYSEDTPLSIAETYGIEIDTNENDDEITQQVKDFLESATIMLGETDDGKIVYQQF